MARTPAICYAIDRRFSWTARFVIITNFAIMVGFGLVSRGSDNVG